MKENIILGLVILLVIGGGYLFYKVSYLEQKVSGIGSAMATFDDKSKYWDKAVEILEDCLEYNTFGECKQRYPQYGD